VPWWYEVQLCAAQDGPVRTAEGLLFDGALGLDELSQADTLIVPACAGTQGDPPQALLQALRAVYDRGTRIASICTGAFTLAAAGLLDGRRAATHWMHAAELGRRWPAVRVEPEVLYTDDGQILSSAGASAGLDLCLHIVRQDHGTRIANALTRRLVIPPHHEGGQAQYIEQPLPADGSPSLGPCLDWARAHLDLPLTVEDLARQALMSPAPSPGGSVRRPGQRHCDGCAPNGSAVRKTSWRTPTLSTGSQIPAASDLPTDCAPTSPGSTT